MQKVPKTSTENDHILKIFAKKGVSCIPANVIESSVGGFGIKASSDHGQTIDPNKLYLIGWYWGCDAPYLLTPYQHSRLYQIGETRIISNDHDVSVGDQGYHFASLANERILWPNAWFDEVSLTEGAIAVLVTYGKTILSQDEIFPFYGSDREDKCFDLCHTADQIQDQEIEDLVENIRTVNTEEMLKTLRTSTNENTITLTSTSLYKDLEASIKHRKYHMIYTALTTSPLIKLYIQRRIERANQSDKQLQSHYRSIIRMQKDQTTEPYHSQIQLLTQMLTNGAMQSALDAKDWKTITGASILQDCVTCPDGFNYALAKDKAILHKCHIIETILFIACFERTCIQNEKNYSQTFTQEFLDHLTQLIDDTAPTFSGRDYADIFTNDLTRVYRFLVDKIMQYTNLDNHHISLLIREGRRDLSNRFSQTAREKINVLRQIIAQKEPPSSECHRGYNHQLIDQIILVNRRIYNQSSEQMLYTERIASQNRFRIKWNHKKASMTLDQQMENTLTPHEPSSVLMANSVFQEPATVAAAEKKFPLFIPELPADLQVYTYTFFYSLQADISMQCPPLAEWSYDESRDALHVCFDSTRLPKFHGFYLNQICTVHDLTTSSVLNEQSAKVIALATSGQPLITIKFDNGNVLKLKPSNLKPLSIEQAITLHQAQTKTPGPLLSYSLMEDGRSAIQINDIAKYAALDCYDKNTVTAEFSAPK